MEILILRHGMTEGNLRHAYIGSLDQPICEEGLAEAQNARKDFAVSSVFVTPYCRTKQTAAILFPNAEQVMIEDLREIDFGSFEGKGPDTLSNDPAFQAWEASGYQDRCPGGESFQDLTARCVPAFVKALSQAVAAGDEHPVFVLHGCVISVLMMLLAEDHLDFWAYAAGNLSGFLLTHTGFQENGLPCFSYSRYSTLPGNSGAGTLWRD